MAQTNYIVDRFQGGLNRIQDTTALEVGEYPLLLNGRIRFGGISPIKDSVELVGFPSGKLQGVYAMDNFLLIFVDGKAYVKNYGAGLESPFVQLANLQMDASVETIYAILIPASTVNFSRSISTAGVNNSTINLSTGFNATPACVVVQDGINQPWLIFSDGSTRQARSYSEWTNDEDGSLREYVPVGKQMLYVGGRLLVAASDSLGRYNIILASVTGRPLDFVVAVDENGNKAGDAYATAHRVELGEITSMSATGADDDSFLVSTTRSTYLVKPNEKQEIFGEFTFINQYLFTTGSLNQFSTVELLGDRAMITINGIRSFNATVQLQIEGKNSLFSAKIQPLFDGLIQSNACSTVFDNYAHFAVNTVHGPVVIVYDTVFKAFVSIDTYNNGQNILQFAAVETVNNSVLFYRTSDNKLYQAFSSNNTLTCSAYIGDIKPANTMLEHNPVKLAVAFGDIKENGTILATCYVDNVAELSLTGQVNNIASVPAGNISFPFGLSNDNVRNISFDFSSVRAGWKIGYYITWNFNARLLQVGMLMNTGEMSNSYKQQARDFSFLKDNLL